MPLVAHYIEQRCSTGPQHDGLYASQPGVLTFVPLDRAAPSQSAAIKARARADVLAHPPTNPLYLAQYAILNQWADKYLGEIELIFAPAAFASSAPQAGKSYMSIFSALQVSASMFEL